MESEIGLITESDLNKENLQDLIETLHQGPGLIPFVGAGLSRAFGFPGWGEFLCERARAAGAEAKIQERLAKGEYEEAAEDLQLALGAQAFEDAIRHTFRAHDIKGEHPDAAVRALPTLPIGPVLTTNFDRVLETVFEDAGMPFEETVCGAKGSQIAEALHKNDRVLWKLHGDFKSDTDRILTKREYEEHYGHSDPAQFNWLGEELPHLFEILLLSRPVLFLGSSLEQDRTVRVLGAFARRRPDVGQYALMENPGEETRFHDRARALSNVGIRPLWYPKGRHDLIGPFLKFLAEQGGGAGNRESMVSQAARIEQGIVQTLAAGAVQPGAEPQRVVGDKPDEPKPLHGRAPNLKEAAEHLASPSTRLVSLIGPSGIGKTALAVRLLADLETNRWPQGVTCAKVDGIAYFSARTDGITLRRLFFTCARMLGGRLRADLEEKWEKKPSSDEKIQCLLEALRGGLYVILLDNMEDLLDGNGHITDVGVRTLVDRVLAGQAGVRFLVTSHIRLALSRETAKLDRFVSLSRLSGDEGVAMLRDLDRSRPSGLSTLKDNLLARVVERLHGVPRALEIFQGILAYDEHETLDRLLEHFYAREDLVNDLFKEGVERLDVVSRRVVEALAVLGQPAPAAAVDLLLQPFVPGLDLPTILPRLSRGQIVRAVDREKGTWALHPIDQDFAYARCPGTGRYSRQTLHQRAAEWYKSVRTPRETWRTLEGLEPLLREFEHRVKAGLYDDAAAVLAEFDDEFRGRLGYAARSLAMHLQVEGRITVDRIRLLDLVGRAHAYKQLGPIDKAIACYREALEMARVQQNATVEIESLGAMGEGFRRLGRLDDAVEAVRKAVDVARRTDSARLAGWLGELGLSCCYRGELKEAQESAEEAYRIAGEIHDVGSEALAIDCLSLVHLVRGDPKQAIEAAKLAIKRYEEGYWKNTVVYVLNVEGLAYLDLQKIDQAIDCLNRAREEARIAEENRVEGMTSFNLAHAYRLKGDSAKALECSEEAIRIFTKTGGGELPAAQALSKALSARAAGMKTNEARALVALARASLPNPDLRHPRGILADVVKLAREAHEPAILTEAEQLLAEIRARDERAQATT